MLNNIWAVIMLSLFLLSACSVTTTKLRPDPHLNLDVIKGYGDVRVHIAALRLAMDEYEGDLPHEDVEILRAAVFDVEFLIMVEMDKILGQPELKVNAKQVDLLLVHGERLYLEVKGVVDRNRMKLEAKDEATLTKLGEEMRLLKHELDLARVAQQLKSETIHNLFRVLIRGSEFVADVVL